MALLASKKLDGSAPVLPYISPLQDRKNVEATTYDAAAEGLTKAGYTVGWNEGTLQVGGSLAQSGMATPTGYDSSGRSSYRPRTSGFLSFNRSKEASLRPRTSASTSANLAGVPLSQPSTPTHRTPRERFSRLAASLDSPSLSALMANTGAQSPSGAAASGPGGTGQFATGDAEANLHHSSQSATLPPPGRAGSTANAQLPSSSQVAAHMRVKIPFSNLRDSERPGTGMARTASGTVVQVPLGVPSPSSPQAQAQAFKASRGQTLMVFNEMDSDKNGKVTRSELEAAALSLGFSLEQAHRLWDRLDKRKRGFLEAGDWGSKDAISYIQLFSTRYMQKYMGVPDICATLEQVRKYNRAQELLEVQSLTAAINKARANAISRGMQLAGATGNPIYDTFQFMDVDNSGALSKEEIRDAFFALGVFLPDSVVAQIMSTFDKDGSGLVQYHEFQRTMFPGANGRS